MKDRSPKAADPRGLHPETSWAITLAELNTGRFPALDRIARALKHGDAPVPRQVRDFLAEFLTGERKRPRGRQQIDLYDKRLTTGIVDGLYSVELERALEEKERGQLHGMPSEVACERVAEEMGMSMGYVRDILGRRNGWETD
jgi:hypothetical protein